MTLKRRATGVALTVVALGAWTGISWAQKPAADAAAQKKPSAAPTAAPALDKVYLTPTCGCCGKWVDHMIASGFKLERVVTTELESVAPRKRVPANLRSCHTAVIGKYLVEGHVPADIVKKLAKDSPAGVIGLSAPNMPVGSPGMEGPNAQPYPIVAFKADGTSYEYTRVTPK
jgi:hypothetical protein